MKLSDIFFVLLQIRELSNLIHAQCANIRHVSDIIRTQWKHRGVHTGTRNVPRRNLWIVALASAFKRRFRKLRRDVVRAGEEVFA